MKQFNVKTRTPNRKTVLQTSATSMEIVVARLESGKSVPRVVVNCFPTGQITALRYGRDGQVLEYFTLQPVEEKR
jgi:hypothetical protein